MSKTLRLTKKIVNWQRSIEQETSPLAREKSVSSYFNLSRISQQISQLKKELDMSFPEFGDLQEITATYNLYRQLETLQQQINNIKE